MFRFPCLVKFVIKATKIPFRNMSVNPNSVQKSVIECKTVKLKMIDGSYFELGETKWWTKITQRLKPFTYISIQLED